ncbi:hypothetical protein F1540_00035 [Haemophilus influenzae biotype aegyptius]|nr:hypothetical protein F1540_00035 [Haemophilus influenzae biotype aegyptius]
MDRINTYYNLKAQGEKIVLSSNKRQVRGRKSLAELLTDIDSQEIECLNRSISELTQSKSVGKKSMVSKIC